MTKRAFGELELAILQILKSGERMSVKDVHRILGEENKYNTVMTVMTRLFEKDQLARERVGLHYEYWLLSKPPTFSFFTEFKKKFFGIKATEMVRFLIDPEEDISANELKEIEEMVAKARRAKEL